ncbi:hypothetical protein PR048_001147 [Dryococelus australis]|uniref:Uncharacterized protein n=1 Tax=Dryococelus australis TaxID=614101 RepID=A0ABQ9IHW2_9NEOP|nr:hypothetical protein PR048_001147 [Dryococelus australis]
MAESARTMLQAKNVENVGHTIGWSRRKHTLNNRQCCHNYTHDNSLSNRKFFLSRSNQYSSVCNQQNRLKFSRRKESSLVVQCRKAKVTRESFLDIRKTLRLTELVFLGEERKVVFSHKQDLPCRTIEQDEMQGVVPAINESDTTAKAIKDSELILENESNSTPSGGDEDKDFKGVDLLRETIAPVKNVIQNKCYLRNRSSLRKPQKLSICGTNFCASSEALTYQDAMKSGDTIWKKVIYSELQSIEENSTWTEVVPP